MESLIKGGANVNTTRSSNDTALIIAASNGNLQIENSEIGQDVWIETIKTIYSFR